MKNTRKRSPVDTMKKSKKSKSKSVVAKVKPDADITHKLPKDLFKDVDIFGKGCLIHYSMGFWGARHSLEDDQYGDLPKEIVRGFHYLIPHEAIHPFSVLRRKGWEILNRYSVQFKSIEGLRYAMKELIPIIYEQMKAVEKEFWECTHHFLEEELEGHKEEMARKFPKFYNSGAFPSKFAIGRRFRWSVNFITVGIPEKGLVLTAEQYNEQVKREQQRIREFFNDALLTVAAKFLELTVKLRDKLKNKEVFRNSTVENLREFIDIFPNLNVTGNKPLADCVAQCKKYLQSVDADALREAVKDDGIFASQVAKNMDGVVKQFGKIHDGELLVAIDI